MDEITTKNSDCNDITSCSHPQCRTIPLSYKDWDSMMTWIPVWTQGGELFSSQATDYLYHNVPHNKDKMSALNFVKNYSEHSNQKSVWFQHRFRGDFEIWREDHEVYQLDNGNFIVHN